MRDRLRDLATPGLEALRRRGRKVAWTPEFMGFGNHLLLLFWAWRGLARGDTRLVLRTPTMEPWLAHFPALTALTIERSAVRFTDARLPALRIRGDRDLGPFRPDWTGVELDDFLREVLLGAPPFVASLGRAALPDAAVVVNVRRGDYYAPEHVGDFGFDVTGFLRVAVPALLERGGAAPRLHVVSDDIPWCRSNLTFLGGLVPSLTYAAPTDTALDHLAAVAGARRLVLTNSTFSYWGGYLSDALHGRDDTDVTAPGFFMRSQNGGRAWLLAEHWHVIDDLPGGWDIP